MLAVNFKDVSNTDGILLNDLFMGTGDEATCPFTAGSGAGNADNIQIFDADTQKYSLYYLFYTTKTTAAMQARHLRWNAGSAADTTTRIKNGDSMWFLSRSDKDVQLTTSGEVELASVKNVEIKKGWNMIGSFFPDGWKINDDASGYTPEFWGSCGAVAGSGSGNADNIQVFDAGTQKYSLYYLFYTTKTTAAMQARHLRWNTGSAAASGSIITPGQRLWYLHRGEGFTLPIKNQFAK
jgi:hypothetical protein